MVTVMCPTLPCGNFHRQRCLSLLLCAPFRGEKPSAGATVHYYDAWGGERCGAVQPR